MSMWSSFFRKPLEPPQLDYLRRVIYWGASQCQGFDAHWQCFDRCLSRGRATVAVGLYRGAEGIYNVLTGAILLSQDRLPLASPTCLWAVQNWRHPLVVQRLVDVSSVIVHETSHALAATTRGWRAALQEEGPYRRELKYLAQLERVEQEAVSQAARRRSQDLLRDALEQEGLQL